MAGYSNSNCLLDILPEHLISFLQGVFWWDWSSNPTTGGACDLGFSTHEKPAEAVLQKYYSGHVIIQNEPKFATELTLYENGTITKGTWPHIPTNRFLIIIV